MPSLPKQTVATRPVAELPFGIQKRVEFARALAADPKLLLLDEPAAGLNHDELASLADTIKMVKTRLNITVLLVQHHMRLVMSISDHIFVLNFATQIAHTHPPPVPSNPAHIQTYP